ncbi:virulence protein RhuM/Fic/DOC family protein [bacterium]|nr:virulence protein RhuM/Fic/DOC family protein [bacterium]MBT4551508.1 virulence protein RhuM/Fic/DOC family protein [bacterium]MBT5988570.1 virulence protein RhuM/Fic/DOC family protein [bacterium]
MNIQDKDKQIVIYQAEDGQFQLEVNLTNETVWLTQEQMASLFKKARTTITEHVNNIFKEAELEEVAVCRKFRHTAADGKNYETKYYNLDVIISVGYRVRSKSGTQFRIWANKILKNYLIQGYAINETRLKTQTKRIRELENTLGLLSNVVKNKQLKKDEAIGLLEIITDYTYALDLLDKYDHQALEIENTNTFEIFKITYNEALAAIKMLKNKFGDAEKILFGREKDKSFKGSLYNIYQTFESRDLYPSVEEKAAHLLYFIIKNHSFTDGNKRIGAFLFIWFLEKNHYLYSLNGKKRIEDNALVAICLMTAESKSVEKEIIIKLIVNLINKRNA